MALSAAAVIGLINTIGAGAAGTARAVGASKAAKAQSAQEFLTEQEGKRRFEIGRELEEEAAGRQSIGALAGIRQGAMQRQRRGSFNQAALTALRNISRGGQNVG